MVLIEKIIDEAVEKGASDIHLMSGMKPILRISRDLVEISELDILDEGALYEVYDYIVRGNLIKDELYKEERKLDTSLVYKDTRLRVNISFSMDSPIFTMRIIPNDLPPYHTLGLPETIKTVTYQPQGVILITGKTNSGKSTTLNALIDEINKKQNKKILTLESPIEYRHTSKKSVIIQKEVGPGKDTLTFFEGVKNALREDADILVIGEIRDKVTMEAAIDMAESGHLVIGTLHTKSCAETVDRIVNFYDVKDQAQIKNLLSTLLKVVSGVMKPTTGKVTVNGVISPITTSPNS